MAVADAVSKITITDDSFSAVFVFSSPETKSDAARRRAPSPDNSRGITIERAQRSSRDVATLLQYVIAIVEYTRVSVPLGVVLKKKQELETEIADAESRQLEQLREVCLPYLNSVMAWFTYCIYIYKNF